MNRVPLFTFAAIVLLMVPICKPQSNQKKRSNQGLPPSSAATLPFADARLTTLLVGIKGSSGSRGSAVWIGKNGYLITCYHVVKGVTSPLFVAMPRETQFGTGNINLVVSGALTMIDAKVIAFDEGTDVAIMKAAEPPGRQEAPMITGNPIAGVNERLRISKGANLAPGLPQVGDAVLLAGYPLDQTTLILQTGIATGEGYFPNVATSPPTNGQRIMLSLVSNPGNSGGPVFDNAGNVIGLLEGNLSSPMRDRDDKQNLACVRAKLDSSGAAVIAPDGSTVSELTPCLQNSGISLVVPAHFVSELADKEKIDLR